MLRLLGSEEYNFAYRRLGNAR